MGWKEETRGVPKMPSRSSTVPISKCYRSCGLVSKSLSAGGVPPLINLIGYLGLGWGVLGLRWGVPPMGGWVPPSQVFIFGDSLMGKLQKGVTFGRDNLKGVLLSFVTKGGGIPY